MSPSSRIAPVKHAALIDRQRCPEPAFDLPPRFGGLHDRRLGGRVVAEWARIRSGRALPSASDLRTALSPGGVNLVWLECRDASIALEVGASLAATFGLRPGPLATDTAFERALADAVVKSVADAAPASFEGGYSRQPGAPATLLTRGVVVPLAGDGAARTACAVVTWTEMLAPVDHDRLRRELWSALAAPSPHFSPTPVSAMW